MTRPGRLCLCLSNNCCHEKSYLSFVAIELKRFIVFVGLCKLLSEYHGYSSSELYEEYVLGTPSK